MDTIAMKKLVMFVNDLMEKYFDYVQRRVKLEVSKVTKVHVPAFH